MADHSLFHAAARCWERAGHFDRAAERYARADAWADAGRCWAQAGRPVDAADSYARAGEPIDEARQWLASPWPERARRPYRQALEMGPSTAAEVEALLGLSEIETASERAFAVASENGHSVEVLRALARITAARGRPDLAARAWGQVIAWSPAAAREVFEDWERAAAWNRSLGWGRPQAGTHRWPNRAFRDVRLELVWEEKLGPMMYGNRGLAWSADGRRFAAAGFRGAKLILGDLTGHKAWHIQIDANSVAFVPKSNSLLVGCMSGKVVRVDTSGAVEEIGTLRMPNQVWGVSFSPQGDRLAVSGWTSPGSLLRTVIWGDQIPQELRSEKKVHGYGAHPTCAWSPDGRTLVWCPGLFGERTTYNNLYLYSDTGTRCITAAHKQVVNGIAFSPDSRHLATASDDRTLVLRSVDTGEIVAPPWSCHQKLRAVAFHPYAALIAVGGLLGDVDNTQPSQIHLLRFPQVDSIYLKMTQGNLTKSAVMSLAFSPDGEHLLMSTEEHLSLFRVYLT